VAAPINIEVYSDALVVLGTAGIVVPLVRRFGLSPVLGYLAAGALLGPLGLGSLIKQFPFLYWLTVVDAKNVAGIAELGVVFLLFIIGMELSFERLKTMRRLVFRAGKPPGHSHRGRDRRHRCPGRPPARGVDHPRCLPGPLFHCHRHRGPFQPWPARHGGRSRQFCRAAGAGSRGDPDAAAWSRSWAAGRTARS
jgi:hypothetical protein